MNVKGRITPLNFSRKERDKIKDRKIAAFMPILAMKRDEIKRKGHGGSLTSDRFQNNETVITKGRYLKKKDMTVLTEIDLMSAMNAVINEENIYILPSEKIILNNPLESEEENATKATEAVERFESSELSRKLFPDMAKIDQAKRMDEAGTFRTMAEITSGFKSPSARPIKLRGSTDKRIRAQIRGFKPTSSEVVSSKNARELRDKIRTRIYNSYEDMARLIGEPGEVSEEQIDNYLETTGISRETLIDGLLKGHEKYIDRTERTQKDFARIINAYHNTRLNNVPYLQKISPYLGTQSASKGLNEKFLNSIAPTAVNLTEPHVIHYIFDLEQNERPPKKLKYSAWWDFLLGEVSPPTEDSVSTPVFVKQNAEKSANRLLAAFGQNENAAAKAIFNASRRAFTSKKGVIDIGYIDSGVTSETITEKNIREKVNSSLDQANSDRVDGESFVNLFYIGDSSMDDQKNMEIKKRKMNELVKMQLAFPISGTSGFYLVPLFSGGFRKQPKGWSSKWVIPTMQILDEYAEVAQDPEGSINGLDLLFIIAARAKSLYNYDLKEAETLLLYTMLNPLGEAEPAEEPGMLETLFDGAGVSRASIMPYGTELSQDILDHDKKINFFNKLTTYHNKSDNAKKTGKENKDYAKKAWKDLWGGASGDRVSIPPQMLGKIGRAGKEFLSNSGTVYAEFNKWASGLEWERKTAAAAATAEGEWAEEGNASSILTGEPELMDGNEGLGMEDIPRIMYLAEQYKAVAGSPLKLHDFWKDVDRNDKENKEKLIGFLKSSGDVDFGKGPTKKNTKKPSRRDRKRKGNKKNPPLPASLQANGLNHAKALQDMVAAEHGQEYVIMQKGNVYIVTSQKEIGKANKKGFNMIPQSKSKFSKSFQNKFARGEVKSNPANVLPIYAGAPSSKFTNKGLVSSEVQIGRNFVKDIGETVQGIYRGLIGGRTSMAEKRMAMAIASMQQELSDRAKAKGGNAVANLKVDYEMISQTVTLTLIATADAIKMTKPPKSNPITAECQKCGHRQTMKSLKDKCEKCGHDKFKSGEYTSRAESSPKLKCTYKKTKRSKPCGSEVKLMKNGRIYKCHDCGAKYEMR